MDFGLYLECKFENYLYSAKVEKSFKYGILQTA